MSSDNTPIGISSEKVSAPQRSVQRDPEPPTFNGNSHKNIVIIDENTSESDTEIKDKDTDSEINVEVLEDEMNLEDLMKQKVRTNNIIFLNMNY